MADAETTTESNPSPSRSSKSGGKAGGQAARKQRRMPLREYAQAAGLNAARTRLLQARTRPQDRFTHSAWEQKLAQALKREV